MKRKPAISNFGKRLAKYRKAKGLSQRELGERISVSQRVIAYYEGETQYPPTHLLIPIAKTLKVSIDEILGLKKSQISDSEQAALWRKLKKAELLSPKDQKAVIHYIEALLGK